MSENAGDYRLGGSSPTTLSSGSADNIVAAATTFFVVMILVGIHTGLAITHNGELVVPFIISFVAAIGVMLIHIDSIKADVLQWFVRLFLIVMALAAITSALSGDFTSHFRASAFFIYNMLIGYAAYLGLSKMGAGRVETTFFWFTVVLIVGAALELYGPIRPLSDWFRDTFDKWHSIIYNNDIRDMANYGAVRPKFFASEPSALGTTASFCLFFWVGARRRLDLAFVAQIACLLGAVLFLVRSPTVLAAPLSYFLVRVVMHKPKNRLERSLRFFIPLSYMLAIVLVPLVGLYAMFEFKDAPRYVLTMSFFERAIAPFLVVLRVMLSDPLWGIGLGNDDALTALVLKVFGDVGVARAIPRMALATIGTDLCNAFWAFWIVFGGLGGSIMLWMLSRFMRILRVPASPVAVLCIAGGTYWQGMGSVNLPWAWFAVFSVAALCTLRFEADNAAAAQSGNRALGERAR